ncbi:MAG: flagellar hook-basal body protein [Clostridia bacterium]|nr:flagellar hook-basal body protein [Clostridia bacterium]
MNTAFYTASTGTIQLQKGLDTVANNIANISTTGYKVSTTSFSDLIHTKMKGQGENLNVGHGVKLQKTDTIFNQGVLQSTERLLDYAITEKNGLFKVVSDTGEVGYTRDGNFNMQQIGDDSFVLVSSHGGYVCDSDSNPIIINNPQNLEETTLNIGVFSFDNMDALIRKDSGFFAQSEASGIPQASDVEAKRGYLEQSGVDIASEMTDVISIQRSFQMNARMVQISDEIVNTINNLR